MQTVSRYRCFRLFMSYISNLILFLCSSLLCKYWREMSRCCLNALNSWIQQALFSAFMFLFPLQSTWTPKSERLGKWDLLRSTWRHSDCSEVRLKWFHQITLSTFLFCKIEISGSVLLHIFQMTSNKPCPPTEICWQFTLSLFIWSAFWYS